MRIGSPGEDIWRAPGASLTVAIEAGDDYCLKEAALFAKKDQAAGETQIYRWEEFPERKTVAIYNYSCASPLSACSFDCFSGVSKAAVRPVPSERMNL